MSRNLCRTDCYFCNGVVALVELPRPINEADAGRHFDLCKDLTVAHAECVDCQAQYLAWVKGTHFQARFDDEGNPAPADLSFRSTFNDEPGDDDLPKWKIGRVRTGPWSERAAAAPASPQPPEDARDTLERALEEILALAHEPIRDQDPWAVVARIGEMAEAALAPVERCDVEES